MAILGRTNGAAALACAIAILVGGCQVYDPTLVGRDAGASDLRHPPTRPTVEDGDDGEEYVYGLRTVVLDQSGERWRDLGLDLDGIDTVSPDFPTECRPPRRARPPSDGNQGIDNTFGAELFPLVDLTVPGLEDNARSAQDEGSLPVLRMRGWNGEDDDPRVDITITNAIFTVPGNADGSAPDIEAVDFRPRYVSDGSTPPPPNWDGNDFGYFRTETFLDGDADRPLLRDDNAYVSGRVVVAKLPDRVEILFPAETAGVLVRLTDATALGRISEDRTSIEDVVVAGRWAVFDLLSTAENVGVCRGTAQYDILSNQLDTIADIRSNPGTGGMDVLCDAISVGVGFTGSRMRWGGLTPGPPVRNLCTEPPTDGGMGSPDAGTMMDAGVAPADGG